jgi:hypothetical protein
MKNLLKAVGSNFGLLKVNSTSRCSTFASSGLAISNLRSNTSSTIPRWSVQSIPETKTLSPTSTRRLIFFKTALTMHRSSVPTFIPQLTSHALALLMDMPFSPLRRDDKSKRGSSLCLPHHNPTTPNPNSRLARPCPALLGSPFPHCTDAVLGWSGTPPRYPPHCSYAVGPVATWRGIPTCFGIKPTFPHIDDSMNVDHKHTNVSMNVDYKHILPKVYVLHVLIVPLFA